MSALDDGFAGETPGFRFSPLGAVDSGRRSRVSAPWLPAVAPGRYILHVWSENSLPETLQALSREVEVNETTNSVGTLRIHETEPVKTQHKNKYGQDYEPPSPNNPVYTQQ